MPNRDKPGGSEVGSGLPPGPGADAEDDDLLGSLHSVDPGNAPGDVVDALYGDVTGVIDEELVEAEALPVFRDDPNLNPFNLTPKELQFCYAYARAGNGAQSARYAGYSGGGSQAVKLLQRDEIRKEIARMGAFLTEKQSQIAQPATAQEVLERFWEVAIASPADLYKLDDDGKYVPIPIADLPPALRRAIKRVIIKNGVLIDYELHDAMAALVKTAGFQGLSVGHRKFGAWSDAGGGTGENGDGDEQMTPAVPARSPATTTTLTFEEMVSRNGSTISRKILQQSG